MSTVPLLLLQDPLSYRERLQVEDYAWKMKYIAMDFVTRAEMQAWLETFVGAVRAHVHIDSEGGPTAPSVTFFSSILNNPGLAASAVAAREPWKAAAVSVQDVVGILS